MHVGVKKTPHDTIITMTNAVGSGDYLPVNFGFRFSMNALTPS